jgi:hypothetical protein
MILNYVDPFPRISNLPDFSPRWQCKLFNYAFVLGSARNIGIVNYFNGLKAVSVSQKSYFTFQPFIFGDMKLETL